jgi:hypothetical protein
MLTHVGERRIESADTTLPPNARRPESAAGETLQTAVRFLSSKLKFPAEPLCELFGLHWLEAYAPLAVTNRGWLTAVQESLPL